MVQQIGETVDAVLETDCAAIEKILNAYPPGKYWILVAYKPLHQKGPSGEWVMKRLIKPYKIRPPDMIGTIRMEVQDAEIIKTDVMMPDVPVNWEGVQKHGGLDLDPLVLKAPNVGRAYNYN